jgi:hypothetical protein
MPTGGGDWPCGELTLSAEAQHVELECRFCENVTIGRAMLHARFKGLIEDTSLAARHARRSSDPYFNGPLFPKTLPQFGTSLVLHFFAPCYAAFFMIGLFQQTSAF